MPPAEASREIGLARGAGQAGESVWRSAASAWGAGGHGSMSTACRGSHVVDVVKRQRLCGAVRQLIVRRGVWAGCWVGESGGREGGAQRRCSRSR